jgi:predicted transcriptional regulator of viral defense system
MEIKTALSLELGHLHQPVVTSYQLGVLIFRLYQAKIYHGEKLTRLQKDIPDRSNYSRLIATLIKDGVLQNSKNIPSKEVFTILGQETSSAEAIACCVDPFCYISHMSAMEYHGFTDRIPKVLFLTTHTPSDWSRAALQRMQKDLGAEETELYLEAGLPSLRRLRLPRINRKTVNCHMTVHSHPGAYIAVQGKSLRISTIGRTFLDMIREPDLCGGIYHVLDVYAEHASRYLRLIVDEIDRHGSKIDKVRAGYILEERLKYDHPTIETWRAYAQRGGSQKLYSKNDYSSQFSDRWCLSINIDEPEEM